MSGIVELAYTVLLGWMRAIFDWFWAMVSGTGSSGGWQWFLSNWKTWLVLLLLGGLVVDWLIWVMRWRPYRVILSRFARGRARRARDEDDDGEWDSGAGYYETEMAVDTAPQDWDDTTFATLSEIDPDWAGSVVISEEESPYYDEHYTTASQGYYPPEAYQAPPEPVDYQMDAPQEPAYWETQPAQPMSPEDFDPFAPYDEYEDHEVFDFAPIEVAEEPYAEPYAEPEDVADAFVDEGSAPLPEGATQYGRPNAWPSAQFPFMMHQQEEESASEPELEPEPEEPIAEIVAETPVEPVTEEPYDPLFNPEAEAPAEQTPPPRRRRRRLREVAPEVWEPEGSIPETSEPPAPASEPELISLTSDAVPLPSWLQEPPEEALYPAYEELPEAPDPFGDRIVAYIGPQDEPDDRPIPPPEPPEPPEPPRPSRLVRPQSEQDERSDKRARKDRREKGVRTVTGKPAVRKGLMRLTSAYDEPIAGLPPLQLTDPFLPSVKPENVDFDNDGDEYDR